MKIRITAVGMGLVLSGLVLASCNETTKPRTGSPIAPTNLVATATSTSQIALTWRDNSTNEEVFKVERCTGAGCTAFIEIATLPANTTSYQDQGLTAGTSYTYRVRACKESTDEYSSYSNTATDTTSVAPPAAPTNLVATTTSATQISLTWQDNSDNEDGFALERCTGVGCTGFTQLATIAANTTSYQDPGLTAGASYSYQVRAHNAGGYSSYSNTATASTSVTAPAAPTNLVATATSATQIKLTWQDNSDNEGGFALERCTGVGCTGFTQLTTVAANTTTYQDPGLTAGTSYSYRMRASNAGGYSGYSNTATATIDVTQPPAAPTNLMANGVSRYCSPKPNTCFNYVNLTWQDNSGNEESFAIERCTGVGCTGFTQIATVTANRTSYQDRSLSGALTDGTSYNYRVRAHNASGYSSYSNSATATVAGPAAPTNLVATATSASQIGLTWQDNSNNEAFFFIERCTGAGCTQFATIARIAPNATSYQDQGLTGGTSYSYRVRAYGAGFYSRYSNTATATTR